jgi:hypothetical protein
LKEKSFLCVKILKVKENEEKNIRIRKKGKEKNVIKPEVLS